MKRLAVIALLVAAFGALMHFWRSDEPSSLTASPAIAPAGEPRVTTADPATMTPSQTTQSSGLAPPSAPVSSATSAPIAIERPAATLAQIDLRAPATAGSGETFLVMIDVQAPVAIRQLSFSVTYGKSILQLVGSTAGDLVQQGGTSVQFEDVSEGSLLVRVQTGVVAGAGTLAALEFRAVRKGVSPLAIETVTYVVDGRRERPVNRPTAYEGSITVE